jgi:putative protease
MPVFEDERGLYFFNNKDLALFPFAGELAAAGVSSFKIEGRMKAIHYIATIVSFYRQLIDGKEFTEQQALEYISRVPNRGYSQGFMKGSITPEDYSTGESLSQARATFVGNVLEETVGGKAIVEVRNKITAGDTLEVLRPDGGLGGLSEITLADELTLKSGNTTDVVNNSQFILLDKNLPQYTILRRVHAE